MKRRMRRGQSNEDMVEGSTKVLLQDVRVLDVLHPAPPPPAGTPTAAASAAPVPLQTPQAIQKPVNASASDLVNGNWVVVVVPVLPKEGIEKVAPTIVPTEKVVK